MRNLQQDNRSLVASIQDKERLVEGLTHELVLAQKIYLKDLDNQKKTQIDVFQTTIEELREQVHILERDKQQLEQ